MGIVINMKKELEILLKFLQRNRLMAMSTFNKSPWICTVYYAVDKDFNLYFVSSPDSKHCKDIEKNKNVACAIFDSHTKNSEHKVGVQYVGTASRVKGWDRTKTILKMWYRAAPGIEDIVNVANMKDKVISSRVYRIKPKKIQFFNDKLYGDEETKMFTF